MAMKTRMTTSLTPLRKRDFANRAAEEEELAAAAAAAAAAAGEKPRSRKGKGKKAASASSDAESKTEKRRRKTTTTSASRDTEHATASSSSSSSSAHEHGDGASETDATAEGDGTSSRRSSGDGGDDGDTTKESTSRTSSWAASMKFDYTKATRLMASASSLVLGALRGAAGAVSAGASSVRDEVAKDINNVMRNPSKQTQETGKPQKKSEGDAGAAPDSSRDDTTGADATATAAVMGNVLGVIRGAPRGPLSSSTTVTISSAPQSSIPTAQGVLDWLVRNGALSADSAIVKQSRSLVQKSSEIVDKTRDRIGDYTEDIKERYGSFVFFTTIAFVYSALL